MAHDVTEGFLPVGVSKKNLDTVVLEQEDLTVVHREMVTLGDPIDIDARAKVGKDALSGDYASVVRDPRLDDVVTCLGLMTEELKMIRFHLNLITEFES